MPDAYSEWLGIPDHLRPPTHYQLLGIPPSELDPKAIAAAADHRLEALRAREAGPRAEEAARLVREVAEARDVLLDPVTRLRYDAMTPDAAAQWWQPEPAAPPPPTPTPAPVEGWWQGESPDPDLPAKVPAPPIEPAVAEPPPPAESKPQDWWKGAAGDVDVGAPPVVRPAPEPPAPVVPPPPPPPPPIQTPASPPAAPLIRESALALTAPEPTGSPVKWMVLGLVAVGLACVAGVYGMRLLDDRDPGETQVAKNNTPPDPGDPPPDDPAAVQPPRPKPVGPTTKTGNPDAGKPAPPVVPDPVIDPDPTPPPPAVPTEPVTFRGHNEAVSGVAVSRSGRTILSVGRDRAVLHYAPQEKDKHGLLHKLLSPGVAVALCNGDKDAVFCDGGDVVVFPLADMKPRVSFENPRGGVRSLVPAPDGSFVLTGTTDGCVRWWDTKTNKLADTLDLDPKETVSAVAISADARTGAFGLSDGRVAVYDLTTRKQTKTWKAHAGAVNALAVAPNGKLLVTAGDDGLAAVWEPGGKLVKKLAGHDGPVTGAAWGSDGNQVVTTGIDKTVRRWAGGQDWKSDWKTTVPDKAYCLALDARDRFALVGLADGGVRLVPLPPAGQPGS